MLSMADEKRPEWMTSISSTVNRDDYLLGRKIDKTFELSQKEEADKAREERIKLIEKDKIKLSSDPILDLERRRLEIKMEIIRNPIRLKQFREWLLKRESSETSKSDDTQPTPKISKSNGSTEVESRLHERRGTDFEDRRSSDRRSRRREDRDGKSKQRDSRDDRSRTRDREHRSARHSESKHRSSHRSRSPRHKHRHHHHHHESGQRSRSPDYHRQ